MDFIVFYYFLGEGELFCGFIGLYSGFYVGNTVYTHPASPPEVLSLGT